MPKQFDTMECSRGAPMGRIQFGAIEDCEPRSLRLFRVRLDSGGYDDGGAYWGIGAPLYCARNDADTFRRFGRARDRADAIMRMEIPPSLLIQPGAAGRVYWWTSSSGRIELQMRAADVLACSHSGDCSDDVEYTFGRGYIAAQLTGIDPEILRNELEEYGAWDKCELVDHAQNLRRVIWIAAGDILDSEEWKG